MIGWNREGFRLHGSRCVLHYGPMAGSWSTSDFSRSKPVVLCIHPPAAAGVSTVVRPVLGPRSKVEGTQSYTVYVVGY